MLVLMLIPQEEALKSKEFDSTLVSLFQCIHANSVHYLKDVGVIRNWPESLDLSWGHSDVLTRCRHLEKGSGNK